MAVKSNPNQQTPDKLRFALGIVCSVLSGLMLLFSFPPYGVWWLMWFGFVPGIFAQYRLLPPKWAHLAPTIFITLWLGPWMARLFGTQYGPVFTFLGFLIGVIVFFGHWYNLEHRLQAIERIGPMRQYQSGYKRNVYIYNIIARGTVDELVMMRHTTKKAILDLLLEYHKKVSE